MSLQGWLWTRIPPPTKDQGIDTNYATETCHEHIREIGFASNGYRPPFAAVSGKNEVKVKGPRSDEEWSLSPRLPAAVGACSRDRARSWFSEMPIGELASMSREPFVRSSVVVLPRRLVELEA